MVASPNQREAPRRIEELLRISKRLEIHAL